MFFGFLCCGEVVLTPSSSYDPQVNLTMENVRIDSHVNPSFVEVNIKSLKTDLFQQGVKVCLRVTYKDLRSVSAILHYLAVRGAGPGPLFKYGDDRALTREHFVASVKNARSLGG